MDAIDAMGAADPASAMAALFEQHRRSLHALARQLLRDDDAAADAVQEAAAVALTQPPAHLRDGRSWLAAVVRNLAFRSQRSAARRTRREAAVARSEVETTEDALERAETLRLLANAVAELDEPYRRVIVLRFFEERSVAQIAAGEGAPEPTVRTRLRRALEQLRAKLDALHPGGRSEWLASFAWGLEPIASGGAALATKVAAALLIGGALIGAWRWTRPDEQPAPAVAIGAPAAADAAASGASGDPNGASAAALATLAAPLAAKSSAALATVRGRVVDESGAPLPGARIMALELVGADASQMVWHVDQHSDSDGRFELAGLHVDALLQLLAGLPGRLAAEPREPSKVVDGLELPPLIVRAGGTVAGIVVDETGVPVAGAALLACDDWANWALPEPLPSELPLLEVGAVQSATSGADGTFRMTGLPTDEGASGGRSHGAIGVRVEREGFAVSVFAVDPGETHRLALGRPARGRVVVSGALPDGVEPSVTVEAFAPWLANPPTRGIVGGGRQLSVERDPDEPASWRFSSIEAPVRLNVRVEVSGRAAVEKFVELPCGADLAIDVAIAAVGVLRGRVVAASDGAPIANAVVLLVSGQAASYPLDGDPAKAPKSDARATSDAAGFFELPARGEWATLRVAHAEFAPRQLDVPLAASSGPPVVALQRGASLQVRLIGAPKSPMRPKFLFQQRVVAPLPGEAVPLRSLFFQPRTSSSGGRTADLDDSYRFERLLPGEYVVQAMIPSDLLLAGPSAREIVLREGESATLEFHVLPESQRARFTGSLRVNGEPLRGGLLALTDVEPVRAAGSSQPLDDEGFFDLAVPSGRPLRWTVNGTSDESVHGSVGELPSFAPGEEPSIDLDLAFGPLTGRVIDHESGAPIAGASVEVLGWPGLVFAADGSVALPPARRWQVPSLESSDPRRTTSDADGRFTTRALVPGRWSVLVHATGFVPQEVDASFVESLPGESTVTLRRSTRELALTLPPPSAIDSSGRAPWGVTVAADGLAPYLARHTIEAGRLIVHELPEGALELLVAPTFWTARELPMPAATRLSIGANESGRIERTLAPPPCGALSLLLLGGDGQPELGAEVVVEDLHGAPLPRVGSNGAWLDGAVPWAHLMVQGGRWRLPALPPGPIRIVITSPDGAVREASAEIVAGSVTELVSRR
ncbi:MAG: sigma-70 family RNA polymerase sigma factor [Planctomycetes bacterium]|nr:sigma-70 family RNA polymerase sigma factor [Planctomycetota bacterium]